MYQTGTKNNSFISMWRMLQDNDNDNSTFMLELKNEKLNNFDIKDLFYTKDAKQREALVKEVINECKENIWFFFREVVRIPNPVITDTCDLLRFNLNVITMEMIYCYENNIPFIVSEQDSYKKYGVTTTLILLEIYERMILHGTVPQNFDIIFSSKTTNMSKKTSSMIHNLYDTNNFIFNNYSSKYDIIESITAIDNYRVNKNDKKVFIHLFDDYDKIKFTEIAYKNKNKIFCIVDTKTEFIFGRGIYDMIIFDKLTKRTSLSLFDEPIDRSLIRII